ncbi:heterokaryon incompatibility protein-domain-containing protein [Xylaria palmicola]|nr:heterokaryon incompatibility protein-domain-containing protein [Xylaria palmicola]
MNPFVYEQIDLTTSAFRLVRLLGGNRDEEVQCELILTTLDENVIPYEAVSYTWGAAAKPCRITVDRQDFMVTSSLWHLLRDLRLVGADRYLWIDAISINQDNDLERGHQVRRMQLIYGGADRVVFYLGDTTEEISLFMAALSALHAHALSGRWPPDDQRWRLAWETAQIKLRARHGETFDTMVRQGLGEILVRPWFRRVWILQEVANARRAIICCGAASAPVPIFAMSPGLMGVDLDNHSRAVFELMPTYNGGSQRMPRNPDLLSILLDFRQSEASDPRDKIYALLGLCADEGVSEAVVPDYTQAESALVRATIRHILTLLFGYCPISILDGFSGTVKSLLSDLALDHGRKPSTAMETLLVFMLSSSNINPARSLLARGTGYSHITGRMVKAAVSNHSNAFELMRLFAQRGDDVELEPEDVERFISNAYKSSSNDAHLDDKKYMHGFRQLMDLISISVKYIGGITCVVRQKDLYGLLFLAPEDFLRPLILRLKGGDLEAAAVLDKLARLPMITRIDILRLLLLRGFELDARFPLTAVFFMAVLLDTRWVLEPLLETWPAEFEQDGRWAADALYHATYHRRWRVVGRLLDGGVKVVTAKYMPSPLSIAVRRNDRRLLHLFSIYSANIVGCDGRLPLHCAAEFESILVVQFLLDQGADPRVVDKDGRTALQVAEENGRLDVVRLLDAVGKWGRLL